MRLLAEESARIARQRERNEFELGRDRKMQVCDCKWKIGMALWRQYVPLVVEVYSDIVVVLQNETLYMIFRTVYSIRHSAATSHGAMSTV